MCTSCTYDCANNATHYNDFMYHIETDPYETVRRDQIVALFFLRLLVVVFLFSELFA